MKPRRQRDGPRGSVHLPAHTALQVPKHIMDTVEAIKDSDEAVKVGGRAGGQTGGPCGMGEGMRARTLAPLCAWPGELLLCMRELEAGRQGWEWEAAGQALLWTAEAVCGVAGPCCAGQQVRRVSKAGEGALDGL